MENRFADYILSETVVSCSRIAIQKAGSLEALPDTLVLTLSTGKVFQLYAHQDDYDLVEITKESDLIAGFDLWQNEALQIMPIENYIDSPFFVGGISIYQSSKGFLLAVILWDANKNPCLTICKEFDEIELLDIQSLKDRIDQILFYRKSILCFYYDNPSCELSRFSYPEPILSSK